MHKGLAVYSWYLECDKKLALVIMERIRLLVNREAAAPYFMVRFRRETGHEITVCFDGKVKHVRVNCVGKVNGRLEYTIDNSR